MKTTIIILLILAGVSLNAIVGDNGVITNAMNAKELSEEVERKENLEYILFDYNSNIASNGGEKSFTNFLSKIDNKIWRVLL